MQALQAWRAARRAELLTARQAIANDDRLRWTAAIHAHLRSLLPTVGGLSIGYYMPFRGEPDMRPLLDAWREAGAETALPVVVERGLPLEFRLWWPGAPVKTGALSLPMPDGTPQVTPQVVLMPPVGFDEQGYRLGYGGGYFDRTLAAMTPPPLKIGVAFEVSRIASIRPQPYDIAMDYIVSEAGVFRVTDGQLQLQATITPVQLAAQATTTELEEPDETRAYASSPCYATDFDANH